MVQFFGSWCLNFDAMRQGAVLTGSGLRSYVANDYITTYILA